MGWRHWGTQTRCVSAPGQVQREPLACSVAAVASEEEMWSCQQDTDFATTPSPPTPHGSVIALRATPATQCVPSAENRSAGTGVGGKVSLALQSSSANLPYVWPTGWPALRETVGRATSLRPARGRTSSPELPGQGVFSESHILPASEKSVVRPSSRYLSAWVKFCNLSHGTDGGTEAQRHSLGSNWIQTHRVNDDCTCVKFSH